MSKKKREIPDYQLPIIETHFHLDYLKEAEPQDVLAAARAVGVERFITIAVSPDNLANVIALKDKFDDVYGTLGIHPHDAEKFEQTSDDFICQNLSQDKIVAVGEIGLDYYYDNADRKVQREVFARQLKIAIDHKLPVVIHTRDADEDTQAILREHAPDLNGAGLGRKGVIHSFTSGQPLAEFCVEQGFMIGINGIATFNKAENVREVINAISIKHLLLETDAPFLTPVPYRGRENAPCYLPFIAEKIAEVKSLEVEQVLKQCYQNSINTFF